MHKLHIKKTLTTPEIILNPDEDIFLIQGNSAPEDVRALYYPVIEWIKIFVDDLVDGEIRKYNQENPLKFRVDLSYFNSSSAKFLYDIFTEFKRLGSISIPLITEWVYDEEDPDMRDAGIDISQLVEAEFVYITKSRKA
jgi:hypothetical protein